MPEKYRCFSHCVLDCLAQNLSAFDLDRISGRIILRVGAGAAKLTGLFLAKEFLSAKTFSNKLFCSSVRFK